MRHTRRRPREWFRRWCSSKKKETPKNVSEKEIAKTVTMAPAALGTFGIRGVYANDFCDDPSVHSLDEDGDL